jgi:antitoxin (DNA-binding transcriptional repressor) of toxin-antitoxin stability system
MQVNMLGAKTKLSQLVGAAEHGEEVFLARNGIAGAR